MLPFPPPSQFSLRLSSSFVALFPSHGRQHGRSLASVQQLFCSDASAQEKSVRVNLQRQEDYDKLTTVQCVNFLQVKSFHSLQIQDLKDVPHSSGC